MKKHFNLIQHSLIIAFFILFAQQLEGQCTVNAGDDFVVCVGMFGDLTQNNLEADISGGNPPYTISWEAEHYSGISSLDPISASFFLNDTTILNPEVIEPYTLDGPVTFYVFVEDAEGNHCMDSVLVSFSNFGIIDVDTKVEIQQGEVVTIESPVGGGIPPYTYLWSPDYNISDINSGSPSVWPDTTTQYHLKVTDSAGCVFDLEVVWAVCVDTLSNVSDRNLQYSLLFAYPNPTSGLLTLEIPEDFTTGTLEIIDVRAGTVHRQKLDHPQEQFSLDIGHLPEGVYHIELYPEENPKRVFYGTQVVFSF